MLKNKDERRKWIDNYEDNYDIFMDNGSIRILESKSLPDGAKIIIIQIYTTYGSYDFDLRKYVTKTTWNVLDRFIQLPGKKAILKRSASDLVDHLKGIKQ